MLSQIKCTIKFKLFDDSNLNHQNWSATEILISLPTLYKLNLDYQS